MKKTASLLLFLFLSPCLPGACGSSTYQPSTYGSFYSSEPEPVHYESKYVADSYLKNIKYPLLYYDSSYETMTNLDKDIALFYKGEKYPENATFIVRGKQLARSKDCVHAAINALKKLQEDAKELGANAVVNLEPKWENESLRVGSTFFCAGGAVVYGIVWYGEIVKIEEEAGSGVETASHEGDPSAAGNGEQTLPTEKEKEEVVVSITADGGIVYGGKAVSQDYMLGILEEKSKTNPNMRIIMKADSETPYGMIDSIKEVLGNAGFTDVVIQVNQ